MQDARIERIPTNGITLSARVSGPRSGPLLVLLHGFPEFSYGWRRQVPFLAERGFLTVAPDQRGYNDSDKPEGVGAYVLDEVAKDVVGLIDAYGREKAVIVGHDWGAAVAWWVAMFHPARVEKMVALNVPHPTVMRRHLLTSPKQIAKSWYMFFFQLPGIPERAFSRDGGKNVADRLAKDWAKPGTFSEEDLALYRESWMKPGAATGMINWYRAVRKTLTVQIPDEKLRVQPPVMLVWGREDPILGEEMAPESMSFCARGRLELIDGAGHFVQHDAPDAVNTLLADFLAR